MVSFKLNGQSVQSGAAQDTPLLTVLTNDLNVNGAKFGCGQAIEAI